MSIVDFGAEASEEGAASAVDWEDFALAESSASFSFRFSTSRAISNTITKSKIISSHGQQQAS